MNKQVCIFEINFYIKIPFQEYEEPVYSYSTITTIYLEVGIHARLLAKGTDYVNEISLFYIENSDYH